jgi:hypothetical protein
VAGPAVCAPLKRAGRDHQLNLLRGDRLRHRVFPLVEKAVPERQSTLDALLSLPEVSGTVGYSGGVIAIGIRMAVVGEHSGSRWPCDDRRIKGCRLALWRTALSIKFPDGPTIAAGADCPRRHVAADVRRR